MAKFDITPELAEIIKAARIQHHVTSKSVAEHIGKSQSYMSKLEKGEIKTIQEKELTKILRFIFSDDADFQTTLVKLYKSLELRFSDDEINEQLWLFNYDTVFRHIPIEEGLVDDLVLRLQALGISAAEVSMRINANEDICPEVTNTDPYPFNEWQAFVVDHQVKFSFIKMQVPLETYEQILRKELKQTNYVTMLSFAYYILKIERFGDCIEIPSSESDRIMRDTIDYLSSHKFLSLDEKQKLERSAKTAADRESFLTSSDKENTALVNNIIKVFQVFSEYDMIKTNELLKAFSTNLQWDSGFMLRLLSTDFSSLGEASFSIKKQLLIDIGKTVERYKNMPDEHRNLELYD